MTAVTKTVMDQVRNIVVDLESLASQEYVDDERWEEMIVNWVDDIRWRVDNLERDLRTAPRESFCFTHEDVAYIKTNMREFPRFVELIEQLVWTNDCT